LSANCYERETALAYAPIQEIMRAIIADPVLAARLNRLPEPVLAESARLLPELAGVQVELPARTLDLTSAQLRFFDAVTQTLSIKLAPAGPGAPANVLFIDDVQWADEATLDLLTYAMRRLSGQPVLLLLAWRGELVPAQHRLRQLFGQAVRDHRATLISLSRLSLPSTEALLRSALDAIPGLRLGDAEIETLAGRLHAESEGLPLFVTEYIAMVQGDPSVAQSTWPMPQTIRDMLRSRLAGLDGASAQLLGTASVIGRAFDFDLLQQVSGRSEDETADGLDHLIGLGLVREAGGDNMDFAHEKLREVTYDELSLTRRRLLHRRTAEALAIRARNRREAGALASQIARQFQLAGKDADASEYFQLAGDHARTIYANAEALSHYATALALGHRDPTSLHEAIGDLHMLAGNYGAAIGDYESAAALSSGAALGRIEHKLGNVHHRRGEWVLADSSYRAASELMQSQSDLVALARVLSDGSLNARDMANAQRAQLLAEQALVLAEQVNDPRALAQAHNMLGILARSREETLMAIAAFERSLAYARTLDDPSARVAASNNLALALADHGEHARAQAVLVEALALCMVQGDRHHEAALHNNIADVLHALGQHEAAMKHLTHAAQIFADIGVKSGEGQWQPEIWKLTEW
jgi:predicted ATPase